MNASTPIATPAARPPRAAVRGRASIARTTLLAGLAWATVGAGVAEARSAPPPPPSPYRTAVGVTFGLGLGFCQECPHVEGRASHVNTDPDANGPVYATATAAAGTLSVGANAATGAAYLRANAGAKTDDFLYVDDPSLPAGAWVPVEVTLVFGGQASYSMAEHDPIPFAGAAFFTDSFNAGFGVGIGTGRYEDYHTPFASLTTGLYNQTWMPLRYGMTAYSGVEWNGALSSVSVNGNGSIYIRLLPGSSSGEAARFTLDAADSGAVLYSASGHNYAPVPEPGAGWLLLAGLPALAMARRRSVRRSG